MTPITTITTTAGLLAAADRVRAACEAEQQGGSGLRRKIARLDAKIAAGHDHLRPARDAFAAKLGAAS